ncbi:MAG: hypothetical protein KGK17_11120 [Betaproteobacteria bacterium]|nr:hypothetical protein [Betaproteobacteria bacterium]
MSKKTGKYFLAVITGVKHAPVYGDVLVNDLKLAGLAGDSIVRPSKMATFEEPSFVKRIGTLSTKDRGTYPLGCMNFSVLRKRDSRVVAK